MKWISAAAVVLLLSPLWAAYAQQAQPSHSAASQARQNSGLTAHHEANFVAERDQANQLYLAGKRLEALPLYEDLCRQDPAVALFAERHAGGLLAKMVTVDDHQQSDAIAVEALRELQRAESLGDTSPELGVELGTLEKVRTIVAMAEPAGGLPLTIGYTYLGSAPARVLGMRGYSAFTHNDLPTADVDFLQAVAADPNWYQAVLMVGDVDYRMRDSINAGIWFAKAVAIDPDCETAYRNWGNALMRAGDAAGARLKYEQAIVAEPYSKAALAGLQYWAETTHASIVSPQVHRPDFTAPDGQLVVDRSLTSETGNGHSSWLIYEQHRVAHGARRATQETMEGTTLAAGDFRFTPTGYVHTLDEEMDAIQAMLLDLRAKLTSGTVTQQKLEPGLKTLLQLQKDNMLEPFILLSFNDAGLRHGYPEYRAAHRDQVVSYIDRYLLSKPTAAVRRPH